MARAFNKETVRAIGASLGRFLAIAGIVALGCGFYAGLRMTGPDMRLAADEFYDGTHLYDVRVLGTLGFDDGQLDIVRGIEGVESAMPAKSTDVMAELSGEQYAMRISSFDHRAAQESSCEDACTVESSDPAYLNRLVLAEGRWPSGKGECLLSADRVMVQPVKMGDVVEVLYGAQELDDVLAVERFTVVGTVHASAFVSAVTQGSTTLGSGQIDQFMYVPESSFEADCPYSEIFVRVAGAEDALSSEEAYQQSVDAVVKRLEDASGQIARNRLDKVRFDAHEKIDDEALDYEEGKQEAEGELSDARDKLDDAREELAEGQQKLDDALVQLHDGQQELDAQRQQAFDQLEQARSQLEETQTTLDDGQAQLDQMRPQVEQFAAQRADLVDQLDQAQAGLDQAKQLQEAITALTLQLAALDKDDPRRPALQAQLDELNAQATQSGVTVEGLQAAVDQLSAALAEGDAGLAEFNARQQQVSDGYAQLSEGWAQYYQRREDAIAQLNNAQTQLNDAAQEAADAKQELEDGWKDYDSGLSEFNESQHKAAEELADAAQAIANARADVDSIEMPDIYILDRDKNYGVSSAQADSERIDHIASVFPFIFFLVAALVALTTMTRMVDEDRILIGTFKALGYSRMRITGKYLIYAGAASAAGALIGIAVLSQVLPAVIQRAYDIIYNIPTTPLPLPIDPAIAGQSAGMGIGVTLLATWWAMANTLREQPASLMLPRAPEAGKRIVLEHIKPVWERLSFSWKVTCRNILRYKKRLFMTVIGIAGCTALLLTGFGLHDAIWDIIDKHFDNVVKYHVVVRLDDEAADEDFEQVEHLLSTTGESTILARAADVNMQVGSDAHDPMGVTVTVPADPASFTQLVDMRNRVSRAPVAFDDDSVVLTEKLARTLGLGVGDALLLYDQDEIGNALGSGWSFTVTGVIEYYVGNALFIGKDAYQQQLGEKPVFQMVYGDCTQDAAKRHELGSQMREIDDVQTIAYNDETIDSYRTMLQSVNMIVVVLVVAAAALAFIVLYNLTNINIMERRREIASLKVLGFTGREVDQYIFRETIILSILGALIGLLLGVGMESFVVESAEVDYVMFGREIHPISFLWAFLTTIGFSLLVMFAMRFKLRAVDMVESLKSVD